MAASFLSLAKRRAQRAVLAVRRAHRTDCELLGHRFAVPDGVYDPRTDGSSGFFYRAVGPMIAPGQRVLDIGTGCGLGAVVAASRGATVVAVDLDPATIAAARGNTILAGLDRAVEFRVGPVEDVVGAESFDLVLWNAPQDPRACVGARCLLTRSGQGHDRVLGVTRQCARWLGERGRFLVLLDTGSGLEALLEAAVPPGYRSVLLTEQLGFASHFVVRSLGWDAEAARRARHGAGPGRPDVVRRAEVNRRRWEGGAAP